jgi:hypothetical protein
MHGPLYLTKGLVKALAKRNDDVVIREARPDGRIAIASGPDLDELTWLGADGKEIEPEHRNYRVFAITGVKPVDDPTAGEIEVPQYEDFGVSLLPRDPQAAKDQYRSQLLPEADDREFVLVPMDGDDLLVPAVNPAVA